MLELLTKEYRKEYIVASILAWLQTLYFLFKVRRGHVIKKKNKTTSCLQCDRQKFTCSCSPRLEKLGSMPSFRFWQTYNLISTLCNRTLSTNRAIIACTEKRTKILGNSLTSVWIRNGRTINQRNNIAQGTRK